MNEKLKLSKSGAHRKARLQGKRLVDQASVRTYYHRMGKVAFTGGVKTLPTR